MLRPRHVPTVLPVALLLAVAFAPAARSQVVLEIHYDASLDPSDPDHVEALAYLHYPDGSGPTSQGFPVAPRPAFLTARGGNSNSLVPGAPQASDIAPAVLDAGLVDVFFNYPVVGPNEDYRVAADGIALLVQYLRSHAVELNLRPDAIALQARSFGTISSYAVALCEDRADPAHPDPVRQASSRPDYYAPRFGPSTLTCFSDALGPWSSGLSALLFPGQTFAESTPEQRRAESPIWWLQNPRAFGREWTPPLFVVYDQGHDDVCGAITDVHSGLFGELMLEALDDFATTTGRWDWRARCGAFAQESSLNPSGAILGWTLERLAEDGDGLWLTPPAGAPGGPATLVVFGAVPGRSVTFRAGGGPASVPLAGCEALVGTLDGSVELGVAVASANGTAQLVFSAPAELLGQAVTYQAVDAAGCESSQEVVHVW